MLNRYGPVLDTNLVRPLGPRRCEVVFEHFVDPTIAADAEKVAAFVDASEQVQREDEALCARVQRGLESGAAHAGPYAEPEGGALYFHRLWHADVSVRPTATR
jgi:choline monooxygenase